MKTWTEYSANIEDYYEWISSSNSKNFERLSVLSFNGTDIAQNNDDFYQYCCKELYTSLQFPEKYNVYFIINERMINIHSKVEHYKKCWKKIASEVDLSKFELGHEIGYEFANHFFYAGIAKTSISNMPDVLRLVNTRPNKCVLFASKNNYFAEQYINDKFIKSYIAYNQFGNIDHSKCFEQCSRNHDLGIRYGTSFLESELALIFNFNDRHGLLNYDVIKSAVSNCFSKWETPI
jgi:hypothetical protein